MHDNSYTQSVPYWKLETYGTVSVRELLPIGVGPD